MFLCYKKPSVWPARIEASEFDRLPRLLSSVVSARKSSMKKEVICFFLSFLNANPKISVISTGIRSDHFCSLIVILTWGA